jgi:hypothetical protein
MATSPVLGLAAVAVLVSVLPSAAQQVTTSVNRDRRLITTEEIHDANTSDTYQVVEKLRPEFLLRMSHEQTLGGGGRGSGVGRGGMSRGAGAGGGGGGGGGGGMGGQGQQQDQGYSQQDPAPTTAVFIDGTQMGGVEELKLLQSSLVEEIRYLSGSEAQTKYGPRFPSGVIEVKLKTH